MLDHRLAERDGAMTMPQSRTDDPAQVKPILTRRGFLWGLTGVSLAGFWISPALSQNNPDPIATQAWLAEWVAQGIFKRAWLHDLLAPLTPDVRVLNLMDHQAEAKPYHLYRKIFINDRRIRRGRHQMIQNRSLLRRIQRHFRVPTEIVVALWGLESDFGSHSGQFFVLRTLYTLAAHYPRRAPYFREELRHFLLLCREEGWNPRTLKGSYAGALGQMQMMPGTFRRYAVDFNGDGKRDAFHGRSDILASIAAFLVGHGWNFEGMMAISLNKHENPDLNAILSPSLKEMRPWKAWQKLGVSLPAHSKNPGPDEQAALIRLEERRGSRYDVVFGNFRVITQWNRSNRFAMVVQELANALKEAP